MHFIVSFGWLIDWLIGSIALQAPHTTVSSASTPENAMQVDEVTVDAGTGGDAVVEEGENSDFGLFDDHPPVAPRVPTSWATTYDTVCQMFARSRFAVPKIIFWNLRATHKSFPVKKDKVGTALLSGFSAQMLKAFLDGDMSEFNPTAIMNEVLEKYEISAIPVVERVPIGLETTGSASFEAVEQTVEKYQVPVKVSRKRSRQQAKPAAAPGPDGDHAEEDDSDN